jgi:acetyl esterase/lipase
MLSLALVLALELQYGAGPQQTLDLYQPAAAKTLSPVLVFAHGGAWVSGDKREYRALGEAFAQHGIAVAAVNYRLSPAVKHPAAAEDYEKAVAFVLAEAKARGLDPARVYVSGHSAGAHMSAWVATGALRPAGFIGLSGIYDVPALQKRFPTYKDWFLLKAFGSEAGWPAASPAGKSFPGKAPWLLIHSKADELVDLGQTDRFAGVLKAQGIDVKTVTPAALDHFGTVKALFSDQTPEFKSVAAFVR